jgi:Ca2+-binding RTX toxin-like protein
VNSNVTVSTGATLSPGGTPGDFATAGVTFNSGSFFEVQLTGADPGTGYDQLIASSVNLGGATLVVSSTAITTPGQIFRIVRNDGVAPTSGNFAGLPEGASLFINGEKFFITYNDPGNRYGTGNDVALVRNQGVIAVDDDFGPTLIGIAIEGNVKDNDFDPDGDGVVQLVSGPANGTLQIVDAATGEFVYTPNPNFIGTDTFTYRLSDGEFTSNEATVTIAVAQFVEQDGNLYVAGTNGSDRIIVQSHSGGGVGIRMNNALYGPFDAGHVVVFGYRGNDTITVSGRVPVSVTFFGGEGNDYLAGGNEDDTLDGGAGNDRILGANGDDLLYGGPGSDRFSGGNGNDTAFGDSYLEIFDTAIGGDLSTLIGEAVESDPSESGRDTVNGDGGDDFLYGEGNNDTINGGHGNDFLRGGDGNDRLSGGNGDDLLIGDTGPDLLYGQNGRDVLFGGDGSDTLNGGSADDLLYGGMFLDDSDETLMATAQFWFDFDDEGAVFDLESNAEDDGVGDLLNGERDADYYVLWFLDRIRLTSETRSPNRSLDLPSNP